MKKRIFAALLLGAMMFAVAPAANADEYDRDDSDMWLRYVAYAVHPIGIAVEYYVLRPIHYVVSKPDLNIWFGHEVTEECSYDYLRWE